MTKSRPTPDYEVHRRFSRLRLWRVGRGLTQEELHKLSGVSSNRIVGLEQGKGLPRLTTAIALATALDTSFDRLWPELADGRDE